MKWSWAGKNMGGMLAQSIVLSTSHITIQAIEKELG